MEKIRKYVERFFKTHKDNMKYQIYTSDAMAVAKEMRINPLETVVTLFDYGYAKGYRAAMAEMKKKGGESV
ncbi:MAG: hypothetical protein K1W16_14300 [Lachnospiraceae bacterium]